MLLLDLSFDEAAILYTSDGEIRIRICRGTNADGHAKVGIDAPPSVKILRASHVKQTPKAGT